MTLLDLSILLLLSLVLRRLACTGMRQISLLLASVVVIFWMQPAVPIRFLDFWLPVATLAIAILSWVLTSAPAQRFSRPALKTMGLVAAAVVLIAATRFFGLSDLLQMPRAPQFWQVVTGLLTVAALYLLIAKAAREHSGWWWAAIAFLLLLFVILKTPALAAYASAILRQLNGQAVASASGLDIRWLGFSYVAFRLIHTLRDRQAGRLPAVSLQEYLIYIIFFPAFSAGPIDKIQRFGKDLQQPVVFFSPQLGQAFYRLVVGIFKKYALADGLALLALNSQNAGQLQSTALGWVMVYAYAFLIYFDFSGYTDIAIGLGQILGFSLPENFNRPYLKPNLTQFWNNWHITLTQWFRAYFFNPFTRSLRSNYRAMPPAAMIFITQVSTMLLIGLWHGVTWNFVIWGLWHGIGLFIHNRFSDWIKPRLASKPVPTGWQHVLDGLSTFLTFNFVALGWVWFALPAVPLALSVFARLFGFNG